MLDVGCGGGILCESLARMGADVTGIDAGKRNIDIAKKHASLDPAIDAKITYHAAPAEELLASGASFDAVLSMEVVEHVDNPETVREVAPRADQTGRGRGHEHVESHRAVVRARDRRRGGGSWAGCPRGRTSSGSF